MFQTIPAPAGFLSVTVFAVAQDETKCYQISGLVPDSISKIYIYKSTGLR